MMTAVGGCKSCPTKCAPENAVIWILPGPCVKKKINTWDVAWPTLDLPWNACTRSDGSSPNAALDLNSRDATARF
jgi:hypothetical protein